MYHLIRTNSDNEHFRELVAELDKDLAIRDGADHAFFAQFNKIDKIRQVIVAYMDEVPVGCGAIKEYEDGVMEVKRMYSRPGHRGKGIGSLVLQDLEKWTKELGCKKCIMETGKKMPEAIALYKKSGYNVIPNYGQYADVMTSVCFEKEV